MTGFLLGLAVICLVVAGSLGLTIAGGHQDPGLGNSSPLAAQTTLLQNVTIEPVAAGERVVFQFSGDMPRFDAEVPDAVRACGLGPQVSAGGDSRILVTFHGVSTVDKSGARAFKPAQVRGSGRVVDGARQVCDRNGDVSWLIGVDGQRGFELIALQNPDRLVVEVKS